MPAPLILDDTEFTPKVVFGDSHGKLEISGRSLPENAIEFYEPILEWIEEYNKKPADRTELKVSMEYFNSASAKQIMEMLTLLEPLSAMPDKEVVIIWAYDKADEHMQLRGQELDSIVDVPFTYQGY